MDSIAVNNFYRCFAGVRILLRQRHCNSNIGIAEVSVTEELCFIYLVL